MEDIGILDLSTAPASSAEVGPTIAPAGREAVIRVRNVVVGFGDKLIMNGLNLDIYRGEVLGFVGGSGTGKSVLTRTILGLIRKRAGKTEDRLEIRLAEVLSDVTHDMGESAALQKDGVERHLQEELAARPEALGEELRLVRREWPTDIGPVDLMCRDQNGAWVAVEIKRVGTIDAVEQLSRYLERIDGDCRGVLAAQAIKPQARTLAEARGIRCVEVDLAVLRGEREPDLTLFSG